MLKLCHIIAVFSVMLLSMVHINAQNNLEGTYLLKNGDKLIISEQSSSGYLFLREVETGNVYRLERIDNFNYKSDNSRSGEENFIKIHFKNHKNHVNGLEFISKERITKNAIKINLVEEYSYFKSNDFNLYGKLVMPQGEGPFPVVVFAQGSGKNSAIKNYYNHYLLSTEGIATFVYDKRGTGLSEGVYTQLFDVLSDDLVAAINSLEKHPKLDLNRLGLAGFSQGGWVAPLAALKSGKVKYIAISYGLVMSIAEEDLLETPLKIAAMGFGNKDIKEVKDLTKAVHHVMESNLTRGWDKLEKKIRLYENRKWLKALKTTQTWTGSLLQMGIDQAKQVAPQLLKTFDPYYNSLQTLKKLNIPMLWLFGGEDIEAPTKLSIKRLNNLIEKEKKSIEIKIYPLADHGMYLFSTKDNKRVITKHPETYLKDISSWLKKHAGVENHIRINKEIPALALVGVNIVNMINNNILEDQIIIINEGKIISIYPNNNQRINALKIIYAHGKFVIPGLHDMHTHLETTAFAQAIGAGNQVKTFPYEDLLAPYLANGITTIQVLSGGEDLLKIRDQIRRGEILGPRIILGSPMLDGSPPILPEPFTKSIADATEVKPIINEIKFKGYDFIKTRANLSKPVFDEIIMNAKRVKLPVIGHIPRGNGLSLDYVISKKDFGIAHLEDFGYDNFKPNDETIDHYVELLKENNSFVITTLNVFDNILKQMTNYDATLKVEEIKYIHPLIKGTWQANPFKQEQTDERYKFIEKQLYYQKLLLNKFYNSGVPIMIGTDALNPTIIPGFSIHREFELILDSGLSPYEAIRMATVIPATIISPNNSNSGTINVGESANIVILKSNPLENLSVLRNPTFVIIKGKILDRLYLDEILNKLEKSISHK